MSAMAASWLSCKVLPGMFSNERHVRVDDPQRGELVSVFVDESIVRTQEPPSPGAAVDGLLRVDRMGSGAAGSVNVRLPVPSAGTGLVVSVPESLVRVEA